MAKEYSDNRQTIGISGTLGSEEVPPDVVKGWEIRGEDSNNILLNGLVPFVQLIGLYNEEQISRLTSGKVGERKAIYVDNSGQEVHTWDEESGWPGAEDSIKTDQIRFFEEKIKSKFIYLDFEGYNGTDLPAGNQDHVPGIILATNYSQVGSAAYDYYAESGLPKDSGGVGITDLQVESGTKEFANRRYKLRMTVTNPEILNDQAEYLKLTSLQSSFLIIYGWSNPEILNNQSESTGWPYDPPPRITHIGAEGFPNGRMFIDLKQENTGGAWFASTVATTMFDFAFNEVGQLEASFTFMPREISFLSTYRVPVVAENMKLFLGTGEQVSPIDQNTGEQKTSIFAGLAAGFGAVAGEFGRNLADVIYDEQLRYAGDNAVIKSLFDDINVSFDASKALRGFTENLSEWGAGTEVLSLINQQKEAEGTFRFPYGGPGIRIYTQHERAFPDPNDAAETVPVTQYNSKIAYYYLGWVLEAMRFSLWDLNRDRVRNGSMPFDVKFRYRGIPSNSHFNLAFQDTLRGGVLPTQSGFHAEALKQFELKCLPKKRLWDVRLQELSTSDTKSNIKGQSVSGGDDGERNEIRALTQYDIQNEPALNGTYEDENGNLTQFYEVMGDLEEPRFKNWESLSRSEKLERIPGAKRREPVLELEPDLGELDKPTEEDAANKVAVQARNAAAISNAQYYEADYRRSLVTDRQATSGLVEGDLTVSPVVRIMHPDFEGQLLYNFTWDGKLDMELGDVRKYNACPLYALSHYGNYPSEDAADWGGRNSDPQMGFVYSKVKNFYFGEMRGHFVFDGKTPRSQKNIKNVKRNTEHGTGDAFAGIICPAISARYFSGIRYQRCQQRWYNKHINFLRQHFEPLIKNKITETLESDGSLGQIDYEPIDLLWLTGRKYRHPLPDLTFGVDFGAPYGAGAITPEYGTKYRDGGVNWTPSDALYKLDEINPARIIMATAEDEESLNQREDVATAQRDELNIVLNGPVNGNEQINGNYAYQGLLAQLDNVDENLGELDLKTIKAVEDNVASIEKQYRGREGELNFWKGRVSNILAELYNKDLVTFPSNSVEYDNQLPLTLAAANAPPVDTMYTAETSAGESMNVPFPRGEAADRYEIATTTAISFGNLQPSRYGYELIFLNDNNQSDKYRYLIERPTMEVTFAQMTAAKIKRYVKVNFQPDNRWSLTLNNIDKIGEIEVETTLSGPGLDYIYMNFLDRDSQKKYTSGVELYAASHNEETGASRMLEAANNSYLDFIKKRRNLLRQYLDIISQLEFGMNTPRAGFNIANDEVLSIQQKRNEQQSMILALQESTTAEISPFSPTNPLDQKVAWHQGGGRFMRLNGVAAQQWALRFSKRIVFGAGDIINYKPPSGGVPIITTDSKTFGWPGLGRGIALAGGPYDRKIVKPANLGGWGDQPKSILDIGAMSQALTYVWNDTVYKVRGETGNSSDWEDVSGTSVNQPPALLWQSADFTPKRMHWAPIADGQFDIMENEGPDVIHLVRAGFVDTELIKNTMRERFNEPQFDSIGFWPDDDALVTISGKWPNMNTLFGADSALMVEWRGGGREEGTDWADPSENPNTIFGPGLDSDYIGPAHLIDQDLDFVMQIKDLLGRASSFDGEGRYRGTSTEWAGFHGNDWVKYPIASGARYSADNLFAPTPEGPAMAYPMTNGRVLGEGEHLPEMPYEIVRQVQHTTVVATAGGRWPKGRHYYSQERAYISAGRTPYNRDFPYGIPQDQMDSVVQGGGLNRWDYVAGTEGSIARGGGRTIDGEAMIGGVYLAGAGAFQALGKFDWGKIMGMCVNDILNTLPDVFERGFFSSVKWANVTFEGGAPLNKGVEEYITTEFMNLFNGGRRIGLVREGSDSPKTTLGNLEHDPTYWDLYNDLLTPGEDDDDASSTGPRPGLSMADFTNQTVQNVGEIPIRREVVDNLLNRKNHNMSLLQFTQQILAPSSIGLNGNVQLGVRYDNGIIDIIPASISYKGITTDMFKSAVDTREQNNKEVDHLLFDYKKRNSLIESVDMSSKMDPAAFLTYQNSSDILKGRDYNVLKLLSYEGVAEDFKEFLDNTPRADNSGQNYSGVITIDPNTQAVKVNKVRFDEVPSSVIDSIIASNPERWARITAMMQGNDNFTTELLAFYMRGVTLIIHGTTHISPFNLINVSGVLPDLEGIYIVTNVTERITPTSFQTILEGKLLRRKREGSGEFI